jgi:predicted nuclease of predicted toxin-antitoxin system
MLRLVSDENFNGDIVRGLFRRHPELELVRVQEVGLMQTPDPDILEWAAGQGRVLLSHDVSTVPPAAYQRVSE